MINDSDMRASGQNYIAFAQDAKTAKNRNERQANLMLAGIERSNLNQFREWVRADIEDTDRRILLAADAMGPMDIKLQNSRRWEVYQSYQEQLIKLNSLLSQIDCYLDLRAPPQKTTEEYIKVAWQGLFWCQRHEMCRDGEPTDDDTRISGTATYDAKNVSMLAKTLRAQGKLQPVYLRSAQGFRKIG